jgi:hypothetical protein
VSNLKAGAVSALRRADSERLGGRKDSCEGESEGEGLLAHGQMNDGSTERRGLKRLGRVPHTMGIICAEFADVVVIAL